MAREPKNRVRSTVLPTRDGLLQGVLKYPDGTSERLEPFERGTSLARAKDRTAAVAERFTAEGRLSRMEPAATNEPDRKPMEAWIKVWDNDRVKRLKLASTRDNLTHYNEHIGPLTDWTHVKGWTRDTLRRLSLELDRKVERAEISWKTAINIWSTATQMCDDAANHKDDAVVCRKDNPAIDVRGPERGDKVGKQFLYPREVSQFLAHAEVPLLWRALLAVAVYCYARDGELRVLTCGDVDTVHGVIRINKAWDRRRKTIGSPKGGRAREIMIEPTLAPLLLALKGTRPDSALLFPQFPSERDMARGMRRWLKRSGANRHELHHTTPTSRPVRFHDARSTGITWRCVRDDPKFEIQYHAGHQRFSTTEEYFDVSKAIGRGFGEVFPALPEALIEAARALPSASVLDHKTDHAAE